MNETPIVILTQTEQQGETKLIERARAAQSACDWVVGECAAEWTQHYARGRTDADFAKLIDSTRQTVSTKRRVWEAFVDVEGNLPNLRWSHFAEALSWDDADECLKWASECQATVREMRAWRKMKNGDDLNDDDDAAAGESDDASDAADSAAADSTEAKFKTITTQAGEPDEPIWKPTDAAIDSEASDGRKVLDVEHKQTTQTLTIKKATSAAVKQLRKLEGDDKEKRAAAKALRKLADELDPPPKNAPFKPPTLEDVRDYFAAKQTQISADEFYAFYNGNGWRQSNGNKLKEWKGCLVTWEARAKRSNGNSAARERSATTEEVTYADFD